MPLARASLDKLKRVHPDLRRVILRAAEITTVPFTVLQTDRTLAQQKINVAKGASKTLRSRHLGQRRWPGARRGHRANGQRLCLVRMAALLQARPYHQESRCAREGSCRVGR